MYIIFPSDMPPALEKEKEIGILPNQCEAILLQQKKLPYSIADVQNTVHYLNELTQSDINKKKNCLALARPLIRAFLYNCYSLDFSLLFDDYKTMNGDFSKEVIPDFQKVQYFKVPAYPTPSKSIREHINTFFTYYKVFCKNSPTFPNICFEKNKSRFSIQLSQIPELLLLFSYYDNRNFKTATVLGDGCKLPKYKKIGRASCRERV